MAIVLIAFSAYFAVLTPVDSKIASAAASDVYLENGKVYLIKNQRSNLYMDVYGINTNNGAVVKQDVYNGGANQQFKLNMVSTDIYELIPLHAQDKRIDIAGGSGSDYVQVQIYQSNSTAAQRFKIISDGNGTGSFKILTGSTNYAKCITVLNASYSTENLIQYSYGNNGNTDNDHWYFEKIDSIGVNLEQNVNVGRYSYNLFTLNYAQEYIFQNITYIVETIGTKDTFLELYYNGVLQFSDDDSGDGTNARLTFTPNNVNGITVKVKIYGSGSGNAKLRLRPQTQIYVNSYVGGSDDINTIDDMYDIYDDINKLNIYVNHNVNSDPLVNEVFRTNPIINNRFYFLSGHGAVSNNVGYVSYAPSLGFFSTSLPSMNDVEFALWATCFSSAGNQSMVIESINQGADLALGFPGLTYVGTSHYFIQTSEMEENQVSRGESIAVTSSKTVNLKRGGYSDVQYDVIGAIKKGTNLTRKSIAAILKGIKPTTFGCFALNPEEFISKCIRFINEQKATMFVDHIAYNQAEGQFDSTIFTQEKTKADLTKAFKSNKNVQDYVFTDGTADKSIEKTFAAELDSSDDVVVYAKLPKGFYIPTPVGNYSPDWAIAFKKGTVKHVFFIAETKGSMSSMELRGVELAKTQCAKKLFNDASTSEVRYGVVDSYDELFGLISSIA